MPDSDAAPAGHGRVVDIFIAPEAGAPMQAVEAVRAVPGQGLEGDRYFLGRGAFSRWPGPRREVTLIAEEDLAAMAQASGLVLAPRQSRRNILTRGVVLQELVGRPFMVGPVRMQGIQRCQPCKYLARLVEVPGLVPAMLHRGGLRARILTEGLVQAGDPVRAVAAGRPAGR